MKVCIACGMPMKVKSDFAMEDESKDYCKFCTRMDGTMQSYDEKLEGMTNFIIKTQGLEKKIANKAAKAMMAKLPAWKEYE